MPTDTSITDQNSLIAKNLLSILLSVKSIKLNDAIFSDTAFINLRDSSILLTPSGDEGRANPFAPVGSDAVTTPIAPVLTPPTTNPSTGSTSSPQAGSGPPAITTPTITP